MYCNKCPQATGNRIGSLMETFVGAVLALGIAFGYSWIITLVVLGTVPFLMVALTLSTKAVLFNAESRKKNYEVAGRLAVDSIENVRTVASLTIEDGFFGKYKIEVKKPYRYARFYPAISMMQGSIKKDMSSKPFKRYYPLKPCFNAQRMCNEVQGCIISVFFFFSFPCLGMQ